MVQMWSQEETVSISRILVAVIVCILSLWIYNLVSASQKFQVRCEVRCEPKRAITPVAGGEEVCLCDEGFGLWRRVRFDR